MLCEMTLDHLGNKIILTHLRLFLAFISHPDSHNYAAGSAETVCLQRLLQEVCFFSACIFGYMIHIYHLKVDTSPEFKIKEVLDLQSFFFFFLHNNKRRGRGWNEEMERWKGWRRDQKWKAVERSCSGYFNLLTGNV